jgi:outer membrane protein TolC
LAGITITPTDNPFFELRDVDPNDAVKVALENRPDLFEQKLILDNAGIEARRKKNELLPQLDFEGGVRLRGLDNHWSDAQEEWMTGDFKEEFATLTFEIPIGLRKGRAEYAKAKYEKRKELLELDKVEQNIIVEVREAVRRLNATRKLIRQTSKTLKYANRRLVGEEKKYSVGRTTNIEVLRAQNNLAIQEARAIRAMTEHYIAQGELEAVKGTVLEKFNIVLEGQALGNEFIY